MHGGRAVPAMLYRMQRWTSDGMRRVRQAWRLHCSRARASECARLCCGMQWLLPLHWQRVSALLPRRDRIMRWQSRALRAPERPR